MLCFQSNTRGGVSLLLKSLAPRAGTHTKLIGILVLWASRVNHAVFVVAAEVASENTHLLSVTLHAEVALLAKSRVP